MVDSSRAQQGPERKRSCRVLFQATRRVGADWRCLAATAIASVLAGPALAQDVGQLVTYRADNQAAAAVANGSVAELIAERSQSAAVQSRARALAPQGTLSVGAEELLLDIGAGQHLDRLRGEGAIVTAPVARRLRRHRGTLGGACGDAGAAGRGSRRACGRDRRDAARAGCRTDGRDGCGAPRRSCGRARHGAGNQQWRLQHCRKRPRRH